MGIGLSEKSVSLNRLPGWDQTSYGYHGDDGNFFSSSGKGVEYGPTFTTGDVVGCGLNFVTRELFFTKNGQHLGNFFLSWRFVWYLFLLKKEWPTQIPSHCSMICTQLLVCKQRMRWLFRFVKPFPLLFNTFHRLMQISANFRSNLTSALNYRLKN